MKTSTSQKIGLALFMIGAVYMFGLGWLYSWRVVPAANQVGSIAYSGLLGLSGLYLYRWEHSSSP